MERKVLLLENLLKEYFPFSIEKLVKRKGFEISGHGRKISFPNEEMFFAYLKKYYFRRVLKDTLFFKKLDSEKVRLLSEKWGKEVSNYLRIMEQSGIIIRNGKYFTTKFSESFSGSLLEWLIGKFLEKEIGLETFVNVRLKGFEHGGDIDIISRLETNLIMIECKESPPNNVPFSELQCICKRANKFNPDIFIFAIDTTLSIKRNIIDNLEKICGTHFLRIKEGVYRGGSSFFIVNTKRDLLQNIFFAIKEGANGIR